MKETNGNRAFPGGDDQEFILWLYREFERLMFSTAGRYLADRREQEEVIQESLRKLIEKTGTLRGFSRPVLISYLSAAVRNTAVSYLRAKGRDSACLVSLDAAKEREDPDAVPLEDAAVLQEEIALLRRIWPELEPWMREVLEGKYILGCDSRTLAERLGCKPDSVRMLLTRARRRARELMKAEEAKEHG